MGERTLPPPLPPRLPALPRLPGPPPLLSALSALPLLLPRRALRGLVLEARYPVALSTSSSDRRLGPTMSSTSSTRSAMAVTVLLRRGRVASSSVTYRDQETI
jgi:hypothetical protein